MDYNNNKFLQQVGNNIRIARENKGFSQFKLATECELSKNQIGRIERAEISTTITTLKKIADILEIKIEDLIKQSSI